MRRESEILEQERYIALISNLLHSEGSRAGRTLKYLKALETEFLITELIASDMPSIIRSLARNEALEYIKDGKDFLEAELYTQIAIKLKSLIFKVPCFYKPLIGSSIAFWRKESKHSQERVYATATATAIIGKSDNRYSLRELYWFDRCLFPEALAKELAYFLKYNESEYELLRQELIWLQKSEKLSVVTLWQRWINSKALLQALDKIVYEKISEFMR